MVSLVVLAVSLHNEVHRHWVGVGDVFLYKIKDLSEVLSAGCYQLAFWFWLAEVEGCGYLLCLVCLGGCHRKNVGELVVTFRAIISAGQRPSVWQGDLRRDWENLRSCPFRRLPRLKFKALHRRRQ